MRHRSKRNSFHSFILHNLCSEPGKYLAKELKQTSLDPLVEIATLQIVTAQKTPQILTA
jgi:hypothetical protein